MSGQDNKTGPGKPGQISLLSGRRSANPGGIERERPEAGKPVSIGRATRSRSEKAFKVPPAHPGKNPHRMHQIPKRSEPSGGNGHGKT